MRHALDIASFVALFAAAAMLGLLDFVENELARGFVLGAFYVVLVGAILVFSFARHLAGGRPPRAPDIDRY